MNKFKESNRWKHFIGGIAIGLGSKDVYCATYVGLTIASSLEFKDCQHDNGDVSIKDWDWKSWDWIDWAFTVSGVAVGYSIRYGFLTLI